MNKILKECPFCGRPATSRRYSTETDGDYRFAFKIYCFNIQCTVKPFVVERGESGYKQGDTQTNEQAEQKAINRWNTRFDVIL